MHFVVAATAGSGHLGTRSGRPCPMGAAVEPQCIGCTDMTVWADYVTGCFKQQVVGLTYSHSAGWRSQSGMLSQHGMLTGLHERSEQLEAWNSTGLRCSRREEASATGKQVW
jgi:hypothetical protein